MLSHLVPHAEEGGAHALARGFLVTLQEFPWDLTCGRQSKVNEQLYCEMILMEGEDKEEGYHQLMKSTHPYLFQRAGARRKGNGLHCEGKGKVS